MTGGPDFTIAAESCPDLLPGGASCAVTVAFAPASAGARAGTLRLGGRAVDLTGTGVAPGVAPAAKQCVVPKLKGRTVAAARRALVAANCRLGKVTRRGRGRPGRIRALKPKAGTVARGRHARGRHRQPTPRGHLGCSGSLAFPSPLWRSWCSRRPRRAATIDVTTRADVVSTIDGRCSLREAVSAANLNTASGGAARECPAGEACRGRGAPRLGPVRDLPGGRGRAAQRDRRPRRSHRHAGAPGAGRERTTVSADRLDRVLDVVAGVTVTLTGVTIADGAAPDGASGASEQWWRRSSRGAASAAPARSLSATARSPPAAPAVGGAGGVIGIAGLAGGAGGPGGGIRSAVLSPDGDRQRDRGQSGRSLGHPAATGRSARLRLPPAARVAGSLRPGRPRSPGRRWCGTRPAPADRAGPEGTAGATGATGGAGGGIATSSATTDHAIHRCEQRRRVRWTWRERHQHGWRPTAGPAEAAAKLRRRPRWSSR